jgi:signal transduction histidine kinase
MSIRLKLAAWYVVFLVITVLGFGVVLHLMLVAHVQAEVDRTLRARSGDIIQFSQRGGTLTGVLPASGVLLTPPSNEFREPGVYLQVLDSNGVPVLASVNLQGQSLPVTDGARGVLATRREHIETVNIDGKFRVRMLATPIFRDAEMLGVLQTAQSLQLADSTVDRFRNLLIGGSTAVLVVALLSGLYLTRKSMNPVAAITRTAEAIYRQGDLSRRISVGRGSDELTTLGRVFNRLLDHIEQSVNAQRRFIGDASHELKTPLTVIRGNAEILDREPGGADTRDAVAAIGREARRMQRVVDDLLAIAELDAAAELHIVSVDLRELARAAAADFGQIAEARRIEVSGDGDARVAGDRDKLERAIRNLVQNAIAATTAEGRIQIDISRQDDAVTLIVADDGHGIAPEYLPNVFERFYRADTARSRAQGGTGLGLTIVKSVAEAHGGQVLARNGSLGGAEFEFTIPAANLSNGEPVSAEVSGSESVLRHS